MYQTITHNEGASSCLCKVGNFRTEAQEGNHIEQNATKPFHGVTRVKTRPGKNLEHFRADGGDPINKVIPEVSVTGHR